MESWRKVWREGVAPLLTDEGLQALAEALRTNNPKLIQGATTTPPPLMCVQDWSVEAACAVSYTGWQGDGLELVGEVEEFFARMCFEIDNRIGEPGGVRWFLNFWDKTPRAEAIAALLPEVEREQAARAERMKGVASW